MTPDLEHLARYPVRMRNQRRPLATIEGTVTRNSPVIAVNTPVIQVQRPVVKPFCEIVGTFPVIEKIKVENNELTAACMLTECDDHLVFRQLDQFVLVDALVERVEGTAAAAEVAVVAAFVQMNFTESDPAASAVFGNRRVQCVAVREHVLAQAVDLMLLKDRLLTVVGFRQRCGVVPDRHHASVGERHQIRHGRHTVERRGFRRAPGVAGVP